MDDDDQQQWFVVSDVPSFESPGGPLASLR
jgi:hypothetical protein